MSYSSNLMKHNDYIKMLQVKKQMTFQQQRIFDTILAVVQEMKKSGDALTILEEGELTLDYNIFKKKLMEGSKIDKINRKILKESLETMVDIKFTYEVEDEIGAFVIFQKAKINFTTKLLSITFGKEFRTENLFPTANYTSLSLAYLNKFSSQYSRILYQYFKMYIGKNPNKPFRTEKTDDLEYIKKILGINPIEHKIYYFNTNDLIKRTIAPAIQQINEMTDITCSFNTIKKNGNKIIAIQFLFDSKNKFDDKDDSIIEYNPPEEIIDIPTFTKFSEFKNWIVKNYKNKELCIAPKGWKDYVIVSLSELGFLHNNHTHKDFIPEEAITIWQWLYKNKHRVGQINLSRSDIYTDNHKDDFLEVDEDGKKQYYPIKNIVIFDVNNDTTDLCKITIEKNNELIDIDNIPIELFRKYVKINDIF